MFALYLPVSVLVAGFLARFEARKQSLVFLALVILYGSSLVLQLSKAKIPFESIIQTMGERGIKSGIGDYWYAYSINFLSKDSIGIEPLQSSYLPWYRNRVSQQSEIALVFPPERPLIDQSGYFYWNDLKYTVQSKEMISGIHFWTLRRSP